MAYSDYTISTGTTGTMMMRVHDGTLVEFWLKSGYSSTWFGSVTFSYSSPNGSGSWAHGYSSGNTWQLMGSINVSSSGNVSWAMPHTGTSGFGGPTTQTVYVQRATVPPAPSAGAIKEITHQSFRTSFNWTGDGGSPVDAYEVHYSNNPSGGQFSLQTGDGSQLINVAPPNFPPGSPIYYWVRAHNAVGWGPFAGPVGATLLPGIRVEVAGVWKNAIPYVKVAGVWKAAVVYVKKSGAWVSTTL